MIFNFNIINYLNKYNNKDYTKIKVIFLFLFFFFLNININFKYIIYSNIERELRKIDIYFKICNRGILLNKIQFTKNEKPKISVISSIYNKEQYILRFLRSIQNQNFYNIEIILIDDGSTDNSFKLIELYQKEDKRIILIKNKINKGTFISRNYGVLFSRGEYLILPDIDDILTQSILYLCYNLVKKYKYEMLRFNIYVGNNKIFFYEIIKELESRPIYQPELSTYLFYAKGKIQQIDFNVSNKFIKREAYIRAINYFNIYYLNLYIINQEDGIMNYILYRTVKSFYFMKIIGYYYIRNKNGAYVFKTRDQTVKFFFIHLKIVFEYSKNNKLEKDMANNLFQRICIKYKVENWLKLINYDFVFFNTVINNYLSNEFIDYNNKIFLNYYKHILNRKQNFLFY